MANETDYFESRHYKANHWQAGHFAGTGVTPTTSGRFCGDVRPASCFDFEGVNNVLRHLVDCINDIDIRLVNATSRPGNPSVQEVDGVPMIPLCERITFPNETVTDQGDRKALYTPKLRMVTFNNPKVINGLTANRVNESNLGRLCFDNVHSNIHVSDNRFWSIPDPAGEANDPFVEITTAGWYWIWYSMTVSTDTMPADTDMDTVYTTSSVNACCSDPHDHTVTARGLGTWSVNVSAKIMENVSGDILNTSHVDLRYLNPNNTSLLYDTTKFFGPLQIAANKKLRFEVHVENESPAIVDAAAKIQRASVCLIDVGGDTAFSDDETNSTCTTVPITKRWPTANI